MIFITFYSAFSIILTNRGPVKASYDGEFRIIEGHGLVKEFLKIVHMIEESLYMYLVVDLDRTNCRPNSIVYDVLKSWLELLTN